MCMLRLLERVYISRKHFRESEKINEKSDMKKLVKNIA
jgi:hypothetical protein